jgi:hypothetical protein
MTVYLVLLVAANERASVLYRGTSREAAQTAYDDGIREYSGHTGSDLGVVCLAAVQEESRLS